MLCSSKLCGGGNTCSRGGGLAGCLVSTHPHLDPHLQTTCRGILQKQGDHLLLLMLDLVLQLCRNLEWHSRLVPILSRYRLKIQTPYSSHLWHEDDFCTYCRYAHSV